MMKFKISTQLNLMLLLLAIAGCESRTLKVNQNTEQEGSTPDTKEVALPLHSLNLPEGFEIEIYASGIKDARSMAMSPNGTLFIGNRWDGKVYAVRDTNGDYKADKTYIIAEGLNKPNGVAFHDGALYVAESGKLWKYLEIESNFANPSSPHLIYDDYPTDEEHGWRYIAFGPDGKLYVPVGAPCNICESENEIYASITRMNSDGTGREIFAKGVRNTVGLTWHPESEELWFTDNNRDLMGDDLPPCELNTAAKSGLHFGYPYCHGGDVPDPEFGNKFPCSDFVKPVQKMVAHSAPLGLKFYTGNMFPEKYKNHLIIAEHGSWNRSRKVGYRLALVKIENNKAVSYETFVDGWLNDDTQESWGRPVDVLMLKDGSILVSDDQAGVVYRITYKA